MRKLACIIAISILITLACSSDVEQFKKAAKQWMASHPDTLELYDQQTALYEYFDKVVGNTTCSGLVDKQFEDETKKAADQWDADQSKLASITTNLFTDVFPALFVGYKRCVNPDLFRRDEKRFEDASIKITNQYPHINKTYNDFSDEISFLSKGKVPANETCIKSVSDYLKFYSLSNVAQYVQNVHPYEIMAKMMYVKMNNFVKMTQRCLTGSDSDKFVAALKYWFSQNPAQTAVYDQQNDMIVSLTRILPHDEQCVQKISDEKEAYLAAAYASFGNGEATINELATKFLYVDLPQSINEARACLTNKV